VSMTTALAIYFLIWWVVLFAVLPWGIRSQAEGGEISPGTDPGAPSLPQLGRKALWTTVIASVAFALFYAAFTGRWLTLDDLASLFSLLR
jgi:predicted secreted protein